LVDCREEWNSKLGHYVEQGRIFDRVIEELLDSKNIDKKKFGGGGSFVLTSL
jgi:hypothetical protein